MYADDDGDSLVGEPLRATKDNVTNSPSTDTTRD